MVRAMKNDKNSKAQNKAPNNPQLSAKQRQNNKNAAKIAAKKSAQAANKKNDPFVHTSDEDNDDKSNIIEQQSDNDNTANKNKGKRSLLADISSDSDVNNDLNDDDESEFLSDKVNNSDRFLDTESIRQAAFAENNDSIELAESQNGWRVEPESAERLRKKIFVNNDFNKMKFEKYNSCCEQVMLMILPPALLKHYLSVDTANRQCIALIWCSGLLHETVFTETFAEQVKNCFFQKTII